MRPVLMMLLILTILLGPAAPAVQAQDPGATVPAAADGWGVPAMVGTTAWPDLRYFSLNDDATRLVALNPTAGGDDNSRPIVVSEFAGGAWQAPVTIANNGTYSDAPVQWLPQRTHPVISGDGKTIAYVGYTGTTFGAYIVDRLPGGGWSAPALLNTGLANTHYWISLSQDGKTLALASYALFAVDHVYVVTRGSGGWSAPVRVSSATAPLEGGHMPSLSADGQKLVYIQNARATFSERIGGQWSAPQQVTDNNHWEGEQVDFAQMSGDGRAIIYWLVKVEANVLTAQDLYVIRRTGAAWGAPEKATATPVLPITEVSQVPAAADRLATRLVYSRPITATDPALGDYVYASHLEISEWKDGAWQEARLVDAQGSYQRWPRLAPDGKALTFKGGGQIWRMTTDVAPTVPPWAFSVTGLIGANGGSLFSAFDNIRYLFGAGAFSDTVEFTHSFWPDPPPPPAGMADIGGIGGVGGLGGSFAATLLGPGGLPVQPNFPVTVTANYAGTDTGTTIPGALCLWWLNGNHWTQLPSEDDPAQSTVTATVDHFSRFALFGETEQIFLPLVAR